eukprot:3614974-Rhodomonas_salina.1
MDFVARGGEPREKAPLQLGAVAEAAQCACEITRFQHAASLYDPHASETSQTAPDAALALSLFSLPLPLSLARGHVGVRYFSCENLSARKKMGEQSYGGVAAPD